MFIVLGKIHVHGLTPVKDVRGNCSGLVISAVSRGRGCLLAAGHLVNTSNAWLIKKVDTERTIFKPVLVTPIVNALCS